MKLIEVFQQLSVGEFAQLAIGNGGSGVILEDEQEKLVPHVNLALTALYKKFNLKEGRLTLELVPGKYSYEIKSQFVRGTNAPLSSAKYLVEHDGVFLDDVLKIERVITELGQSLPLNDEEEAYSAYTPTATRLRLPADLVNQVSDLPAILKTASLELVYRANHPKLEVGGAYGDLEDTELELPDSYMEALLYFVASRVHNPIGMVNEFNAGNNYYAKYLAACQDLENQNLQTDRTSGNTRAQRGGWV